MASILLTEPLNALSLPTWLIHVSSLVEWLAAMGLVWRFASATGNEKWKGVTWGMLPVGCLNWIHLLFSWGGEGSSWVVSLHFPSFVSQKGGGLASGWL